MARIYPVSNPESVRLSAMSPMHPLFSHSLVYVSVENKMSLQNWPLSRHRGSSGTLHIILIPQFPYFHALLFLYPQRTTLSDEIIGYMVSHFPLHLFSCKICNILIDIIQLFYHLWDF